MNQKHVGIKIAQRRKELGLTQAVLAEKLQVTNKAVSKWETGEGYPDITLIKKLANQLELSVDELLEDNEDKVDEVREVVMKKSKHDVYLAILHVAVIYTFVLPFLTFNVYMFDIDALPGLTITQQGFQLLFSSPNNAVTMLLILGLYVIVIVSILKVIRHIMLYVRNHSLFDFLTQRRVVLVYRLIGLATIVTLLYMNFVSTIELGVILLSIVWGVGQVYEVLVNQKSI